MSCMDVFLTIITGGLRLPVWYFMRRSKKTAFELQEREFQQKRQMQLAREQHERQMQQSKGTWRS